MRKLSLPYWLPLVLAAATLAAGFAPRDRRAVPEPTSVEEPTSTEPVSTPATSTKTKEYCAPQTPCGWTIYKPNTGIIEYNLTNSYCDCRPGYTCVDTEDDQAVSAYVFRCRVTEATAEDSTDSSTDAANNSSNASS